MFTVKMVYDSDAIKEVRQAKGEMSTLQMGKDTNI